ncbi:hypothetical protein RN001_003278 [Aquatica leii]|uniref:Uncharacterized protein n=1 Tax=Aquatica leii TaxID=1421715 RepID=A0AAN7PI29_9COLE|nr:hypothetical protein RN001_003278 [Aquatica leii]
MPRKQGYLEEKTRFLEITSKERVKAMIEDEITEIVQEFPSKFPNYVLYVLNAAGYDNLLSLASLKDNFAENISNIEKFAREDLQSLIRSDQKQLFYGAYANNPSKFKIVQGHLVLLKKLAEMSQIKIEKKTKAKHQEENQKGISQEARKGNQANSKPQEPIKHIKTLTLNYIKSFCKKEINVTGKDTDGYEKLKNLSEQFETLLENIKFEIESESIIKISCIYCDHISKAYCVNAKYGKKWVMSNFNAHFVSHFKLKSKRSCEDTGMSKKSKLKNPSIASFFSTSAASTSKSALSNALSSSGPSSNSSLMNSIEVIQDEMLPTNNFFEENETTADKTQEAGSFAVNPQPQCSKWKDEKYSKRERHLRKLQSFDPLQYKLTDFYELIKEITNSIQKSEVVKSKLRENVDSKKNDQNDDIGFMMKMLFDTAKKNMNKKENLNRFSDPMKLFGLYIYLTGGPIVYDFLAKNFKNIFPSIPTLSRSLTNETSPLRIIEGVVRIDQLKVFLEKRNLPMKVFISEDQTSIIQRAEYDSSSNKMIGFVADINEKSGFPKNDMFVVNKLTDIQAAFSQRTKAKNVYVFIAQPLKDKAPPLLLTAFGTDNKFNSEQVMKRWKFIKQAAEQQGVEVLGYASDGDPRCLKAMKLWTHLPSSDTNIYSPYFQMNFNVEIPTVFQDTVHIATKLKTRFLKPDVHLPMRNYNVSVKHIEQLMDNVSKEKHLLQKSYLESTDKMNFNSIDKLCSENVIVLLKQQPEANGTRQYLLLVRNILKAYLDKTLNIIERIYSAWYPIFFYDSGGNG